MFKFEFTLDETNKILGALGKVPYEHVADLIANIREQAAPQIESVTAQAKSEVETETK